MRSSARLIFAMLVFSMPCAAATALHELLQSVPGARQPTAPPEPAGRPVSLPGSAAVELGPIRRYTDGDWSDFGSAQTTMRVRENALRAAGFAVVNAQVYERDRFGDFFFVIEYAERGDRACRPNCREREIERYAEGGWDSFSTAQVRLRARENALRAAGFALISGRVRELSGGRFEYVIEYVERP